MSVPTIFDRLDQAVTAWLHDRTGVAPPAPPDGPPKPAPTPTPTPTPAPSDAVDAVPVASALVMLSAPGGGFYREWKRSDDFGSDYEYSMQSQLPGADWSPGSGAADFYRTLIGGFLYSGGNGDPQGHGMAWDVIYQCDKTGPHEWVTVSRGKCFVEVGGQSVVDEQTTETVMRSAVLNMKAGEFYLIKAGICTFAADKVTTFSVRFKPPGGALRAVPSLHSFPPADMPPAKLPIPDTLDELPQPDWNVQRSQELSVGFKLFPDDYAWYQDVSGAELDPNSDRIIATLAALSGGKGMRLHHDFGNADVGGIPFNDVTGDFKLVDVTFDSEAREQSDPGQYMMIDEPYRETGDDHHVLLLNRSTGDLHELYNYRRTNGKHAAYSGAKFKLGRIPVRPAGNTSADASGGPMMQGLIRPEEVFRDKRINHAVRFILSVDAICPAYTSPASHLVYDRGPKDGSGVPMGCRFRLKRTPEIQALIASLHPDAQVIAVAMQTYGLIVTDGTNSRTEAFFSGAPDARWITAVLASIKEKLNTNHLEVVRMGPIVMAA